MIYRTLPHGGEKIGIIGPGTSAVGEVSAETVIYAPDHGVNYIDFGFMHCLDGSSDPEDCGKN